MKASSLQIAVLKGGWSEERDVSLKTGEAVAAALRSLGHRVDEVDVKSKDFDLPKGTEFGFICLHGTFGEDGGVQSRLISEKIRFNGSGVGACRRSWNKLEAKAALIRERVPTPKGEAWNSEMEWPFPFILKPVSQGSSIGVFRIPNGEGLEEVKAKALEYKGEMMVERMIVGRELTVGILGDEALPVVEIRPKQGFYDYHNKYTKGATEYLCPAPLDEELEQKVRGIGLAAHRALGCEVYSRVDIILNTRDECFVLEANTVPGMTELSLFPMAAKEAGLSFPALCQRMIDLSWDVKREKK